jgi:predicted ATPase
MLERWTDRDKRWNQAEAWLKKIEADMTEMKTPIKGNRAYFETTFGNIPVSVSLQGSGFQTATAIIAAFVFSPEDTTLIIEEPEVFLHSDSQEVLVDLINNTVNNEKKQVIFSTHSWNILLPFFSDIGVEASRRTDEHVRANTNNFSMYTFGKKSGKVSIETYPLHQKTFRQFREDFKMVLG